jgi:hypothetical protein
MVACNAPRDASVFSAHPHSCSGPACLMGQSRWSSPIGAQSHAHSLLFLLDTNRREALARLLLDGSATLDAELLHRQQLDTESLLRIANPVFRPLCHWFYIHASRLQLTSLVQDPLTVCCPAERVCCLLVLNLVSSTLPCIRRPRLRLRVLDVCGFV